MKFEINLFDFMEALKFSAGCMGVHKDNLSSVTFDFRNANKVHLIASDRKMLSKVTLIPDNLDKGGNWNLCVSLPAESVRHFIKSYRVQAKTTAFVTVEITQDHLLRSSIIFSFEACSSLDTVAYHLISYSPLSDWRSLVPKANPQSVESVDVSSHSFLKAAKAASQLSPLRSKNSSWNFRGGKYGSMCWVIPTDELIRDGGGKRFTYIDSPAEIWVILN